MIEFCTKKRMAFAIILLVVVSVIVLILENGISAFRKHDMKDITSAPNDSAAATECWLKEKFTLKSDCVKCSNSETLAKKAYCLATGYKQLVHCEKSGDKYKSCDEVRDTAKEEKHFWIFEGVTLLIGLISYGMVILRQRKLDKYFLEKINKQIASGV